jgi:hypothetical protein
MFCPSFCVYLDGGIYAAAVFSQEVIDMASIEAKCGTANVVEATFKPARSVLVNIDNQGDCKVVVELVIEGEEKLPPDKKGFKKGRSGSFVDDDVNAVRISCLKDGPDANCKFDYSVEAGEGQNGGNTIGPASMAVPCDTASAVEIKFKPAINVVVNINNTGDCKVLVELFIKGQQSPDKKVFKSGRSGRFKNDDVEAVKISCLKGSTNDAVCKFEYSIEAD